jgi:hypothetical protein
MILKVHAACPRTYEIGDEIWHCALGDLIADEAEEIAEAIEGDVLRRRARVQHVIAEMITTLVRVGDSYRAANGVLYALIDTPAGLDAPGGEDRLSAVNPPSPIVAEVLRFEDLEVGALADRRAVVRWSDGTESEALRWYQDEVLVCEGDLVGKTREEIRSLRFRRDSDWLQS